MVLGLKWEGWGKKKNVDEDGKSYEEQATKKFNMELVKAPTYRDERAFLDDLHSSLVNPDEPIENRVAKLAEAVGSLAVRTGGNPQVAELRAIFHAKLYRFWLPRYEVLRRQEEKFVMKATQRVVEDTAVVDSERAVDLQGKGWKVLRQVNQSEMQLTNEGKAETVEKPWYTMVKFGTAETQVDARELMTLMEQVAKFRHELTLYTYRGGRVSLMEMGLAIVPFAYGEEDRPKNVPAIIQRQEQRSSPFSIERVADEDVLAKLGLG